MDTNKHELKNKNSEPRMNTEKHGLLLKKEKLRKTRKNAKTNYCKKQKKEWIPAFAGMTKTKKQFRVFSRLS